MCICLFTSTCRKNGRISMISFIMLHELTHTFCSAQLKCRLFKVLMIFTLLTPCYSQANNYYTNIYSWLEWGYQNLNETTPFSPPPHLLVDSSRCCFHVKNSDLDCNILSSVYFIPFINIEGISDLTISGKRGFLSCRGANWGI